MVDDGSTDGTAQVARARGARVVRRARAPAGLGRQAVGAAAGPRGGARRDRRHRWTPTRARARGCGRAGARRWRTPTSSPPGARFVCDTAGRAAGCTRRCSRRSSTASARRTPTPGARPARVLVNGQCTAVRRAALLAAGGYAAAAGPHDRRRGARPRRWPARGWRVAFRDGGALLEVDMHDSAGEVWREWGRSLALPDVTPRRWQAADLAVVWLDARPAGAAARSPARRAAGPRAARWLRARRCSARWRRAYARRGVPFWLSPLADPAAAVRLTWSALRPARRWRGRTYARRASEQHADEASSARPVADTCSTGSNDQLHEREARTRRRARPTRTRSRAVTDDAERQRRQRRRAATARTPRRRSHHRLAAAEARRTAGRRGRPSRPRRRPSAVQPVAEREARAAPASRAP